MPQARPVCMLWLLFVLIYGVSINGANITSVMHYYWEGDEEGRIKQARNSVELKTINDEKMGEEQLLLKATKEPLVSIHASQNEVVVHSKPNMMVCVLSEDASLAAVFSGQTHKLELNAVRSLWYVVYESGHPIVKMDPELCKNFIPRDFAEWRDECKFIARLVRPEAAMRITIGDRIEALPKHQICLVRHGNGQEKR